MPQQDCSVTAKKSTETLKHCVVGTTAAYNGVVEDVPQCFRDGV